MKPNVSRFAALVLIAFGFASTVTTAKLRSLPFFATGYVCIRSDRTLLVDTPQKPTCRSSVGLSLPVLPRRLRPKVRNQQRDGWSVTPEPAQITGTVTGTTISIQELFLQVSRSERGARSLSTVEVAAFEVVSADQLTDPNAIFERLPVLAAAAPTSTIRLARTMTGRSFQYGAQVRDPSLTAEHYEALRSLAAREKIAIRITTTPAVIVTARCEGLPATNQQLMGFGIGPASRSSGWARNAQRWIPTTITCDELSQVQVVQAPIVGSLRTVLRDDTDTVVDATLRIGN
jgi:hypothetical protein